MDFKFFEYLTPQDAQPEGSPLRDGADGRGQTTVENKPHSIKELQPFSNMALRTTVQAEFSIKIIIVLHFIRKWCVIGPLGTSTYLKTPLVFSGPG